MKQNKELMQIHNSIIDQQTCMKIYHIVWKFITCLFANVSKLIAIQEEMLLTNIWDSRSGDGNWPCFSGPVPLIAGTEIPSVRDELRLGARVSLFRIPAAAPLQLIISWEITLLPNLSYPSL